MEKHLIKKGLAIAIIILFIGVSFQPVFAVDTKKSMINNQSEECKECQDVSKSDLIRVGWLLKKVEVYSKLLLVLSRCNPEFRKISEELSNNISISLSLLEGWKSYVQYKDRSFICDILEPIHIISVIIFQIIFLGVINSDSLLLFLISLPILIVFSGLLTFLEQIMVKLDCNISP